MKIIDLLLTPFFKVFAFLDWVEDKTGEIPNKILLITIIMGPLYLLVYLLDLPDNGWEVIILIIGWTTFFMFTFWRYYSNPKSTRLSRLPNKEDTNGQD